MVVDLWALGCCIHTVHRPHVFTSVPHAGFHTYCCTMKRTVQGIAGTKWFHVLLDMLRTVCGWTCCAQFVVGHVVHSLWLDMLRTVHTVYTRTEILCTHNVWVSIEHSMDVKWKQDVWLVTAESAVTKLSCAIHHLQHMSECLDKQPCNVNTQHHNLYNLCTYAKWGLLLPVLIMLQLTIMQHAWLTCAVVSACALHCSTWWFQRSKRAGLWSLTI